MKKTKPLFTIGIIAEILDLSVHTLRMYEREGLVCPHRTATGRRLYSEIDLELLFYIKKLIKEKGLNLAGIKTLLALIPCWEIKECPESTRTICEAFKVESGPCWALQVNVHLCHVDACRTCEVYQLVAQSQNVKNLVYQYK